MHTHFNRLQNIRPALFTGRSHIRTLQMVRHQIIQHKHKSRGMPKQELRINLWANCDANEGRYLPQNEIHICYSCDLDTFMTERVITCCLKSSGGDYLGYLSVLLNFVMDQLQTGKLCFDGETESSELK